MIPYENLSKVNAPFSDQFIQQFDIFLNKGWYILGDEVKNFENQFAAYHHTNACIGVANGLDALYLSLIALNFPKGSEIIVPANTYIASILGIIHAGHIPVLVEPDIITYNIDTTKIEAAITAKTKAIMVVHLYGKCCNMDPIVAISEKHGLQIVEDCAQAHGATYNGKLAGSFGILSAFSFYPSKNLGALGDAGAILTNDIQLSDSVRKLRNYGSSVKYFNDLIGYNSRLDELQAIFLQIKLPYLEAMNQHKKRLAKLYFSNLSNQFILPSIQENQEDVYHIFNIRHHKRDGLKHFLQQKGIGSEIHYPVPPNKQKAMVELLGKYSFPISEEIHSTTLSLPCSTCHSENDILKVIEVLNSF